MIKSRALNVCVNMAMGSSDTLEKMLGPGFGIFQHVYRVLDYPQTYESLENCLWFLANASGDSAKLCEKVINETNLLHNLSKYSEPGFIHLIDEEIA